MKKELSDIKKKFNRIQEDIARSRDELRDLYEEIDSLRGAADDALESMGLAIDRLSELV